jgi:hypothetical protein
MNVVTPALLTEPMMQTYLSRLAITLGIMALLSGWALPLLERRLAGIASPRLLRVLWGLTMLACLTRLAGVLYPPFVAHDLPLNLDRQIQTVTGNLIITARSQEFGGGVTIYPPAPYVVFAPLLLIGFTPTLLIHSAMALLEGFTVLTVGVLARMLGTSSRAAVLSALIYAALPLGLTAIWWGFTAQIFGQALMVPLALALLVAIRHQSDYAWLVAGVLLTMALLSHIGVALLAGAWMGLLFVIISIRRSLPAAGWWRLVALLVGSSAVSFVLLYEVVALSMLGELHNVSNSGHMHSTILQSWFLFRGMQAAYQPVGLVLAIAGSILLLSRWMPPGGKSLIVAWYAAAVLFIVVEIQTGLQVRHIYLLVPLVAIASGLLLDRSAARSRPTLGAAWAVCLLLLLQGTLLWYSGAIEGVRMPLVAFLR